MKNDIPSLVGFPANIFTNC